MTNWLDLHPLVQHDIEHIHDDIIIPVTKAHIRSLGKSTVCWVPLLDISYCDAIIMMLISHLLSRDIIFVMMLHFSTSIICSFSYLSWQHALACVSACSPVCLRRAVDLRATDLSMFSLEKGVQMRFVTWCCEAPAKAIKSSTPSFSWANTTNFVERTFLISCENYGAIGSNRNFKLGYLREWPKYSFGKSHLLPMK